MARRKKRRRKNRRWQRQTNNWYFPKVTLEAETKRTILLVMALALAAFFGLAIFGLAGMIGGGLVTLTRSLIGGAVYLAPLALLGYAVVLFRGAKADRPTGASAVGLLLSLISLVGLLSLMRIDDESVKILSGEAGGAVGWLLATFFHTYLGFWGTLILLIAGLGVGLILFFNVSLRWLLERLQKEEQESDVDVSEEKESISKKGFFRRDHSELKQSTFEVGKAKADDKKEGIEEEEPIEDTSGEAVPERKEETAAELGVALAEENKSWKFPPLHLLEQTSSIPKSGDIKANAKIIQQTLANFGIDVEMGEVNVGPTVTQYKLKPSTGVKLSKITALQNDLALALAAHPIRIEAPIPGQPFVGIEIPNKAVVTVRLRDLIEEDSFQRSSFLLSMVLGRDVAGEPIIADLDRMPHLLIAGATGSGKSVCINAILTSLLYRNSPGRLKLILVDPKRVELAVYNDVPHLLTPVVVEPKKTINSLRWAVMEMERRYKLLSETHKRDIASYNSGRQKQKLPYIVIVIDELADIMAAHASEVEAAIVRLAQMARAVGLHLIVATQRPSVDVITGLIKANITSRIAFSVASQIDSRTIIDAAGAEKLLGNGDMLFVQSDLGKPKRIQGVFVSEREVKSVTNFLREQALPEYNDDVTETHSEANDLVGGIEDDSDPLLEGAKQVVLEAGKGSASLLQRRLRVGYARAARLLDLLEREGLVGPADGSKPREILSSEQTSDDILGSKTAEEPGLSKVKPESKDNSRGDFMQRPLS